MPTRRIFLVVFLVSGAAGLLYQVTWSRLLTLHMGHTVAAVGTVLAAVMGGLALGAALAGRYASRLDRPRALMVYAYLEIAVAASAALVPIGLALCRPLLAAAYADGAGASWFGLVRLASSLVLLIVPAAAMGATFPVAVRWFVGRPEEAGAQAGWLYALNTVGAAVGAGVSGFVLLPAIGLMGTTYVGVGLNLAAAGAAFWLAGRAPGEAAETPPLPTPAAWTPGPVRRKRAGRRRPGAARHGAAPATPTVGRPWLAAAALGVSGFVALTYEVAWTRILALIIGPTTYAFSAMLTAFIGGLALGAALGAHLVDRVRHRLVALGLTLVLAALGALAVTWFVGQLPVQMARAVAAPDAQFGRVIVYQTALVAALFLPMTIALGAAFPFALAVAARPGGATTVDVAIVYVLNTLGAIAGALASSFLFVPWHGLQHTIVGASLVAVGMGVILVLLSRNAARGLRGMVWMAAAGAIAVAAAVPTWSSELLSSGAYKYAPYIRQTDLEAGLRAGELLYYAEGAAGTVSVRRVAGTTALAIDGKVDATNAGDMLTQSLLAHLPLLLHPAPEKVAIIGLGSGVTLGASLTHPVSRVDTLEISPQVVEASAFFEVENRGALSDPRTHLIVGDGRSHLLLSSRRYDVIISEPSNPWMAGVATLFTQEFFLAARDRLNPGGILCQWAHTYDISDADLRSITATFLSVFPDGSLWLVGDGDVLLIGSEAPLDTLLDGVPGAWTRPGVASDLMGVNLRDPFALLSLFVAGGATVQGYVGDAQIQTDDRNSLEFSAPRGIYGRTEYTNATTLRALRSGAPVPAAIATAAAEATGEQWRNRGMMYLRAEAFGAAFDDFATAVRQIPTDRAALDGLFQASAAGERQDEAIALLEQITGGDPANVPARIQLSRLLASVGRVDDAIRVATSAVDLDPTSPTTHGQLASVFADLGDATRLESVVERLSRGDPDHDETLYYAASLRFLREEYAAAADLAGRLVARDPDHGRAQNLLGAALASLGRVAEARRAFQASVRADPTSPGTYVNLGVFELQAANAVAAAAHFAEALTLDPASPAALSGLADALELQGHAERAATLRQRLAGLVG